MSEELYELIKQEKISQEAINKLSKEELISEETFLFIESLEDKFEKEQYIMRLQEKAKKENCLSNFNKMLKQNCDEEIKKVKVNHNEIAEKLLETNFVRVYENILYIYDDGVYVSDKRNIEKKIKSLVPEGDSRFREEVYKDLLLIAEEAKFDRESNKINFKNGLLNLEEMKLYEHTPDFFSTNQISINYNENAKEVQAVDNFLNRITDNDLKRKQTILEMIGYSLTTSVKLQKAFVLYGETARNGKSTLCNIIIELIGRKNISSISFKDMCQNAFASSCIKGKLINIGTEMTKYILNDISTFKMFTTGDYLSIEEKCKPRQMILPYAKFIFCANELPRVDDTTDGFYRRLQIIPFKVSFSDLEAKNFNFDELITEEALEYLARISVKAYTTLGKQFSNYAESEREVNKYRIEYNSILTFANDNEAINALKRKGEYISANDIYAEYSKYCKINGYMIIGRNKFYKEFEELKFVNVKMINNQKYYILNI